MPIPVLDNIDLSQNQIVNVVVHKNGEFPLSPTPISGQIFYKTGANEGFYYYDGTTWRGVGDITSVNATNGGGLTGGANAGDVNLVVNTDNTTLEINSATNQVIIKDGGVSTVKLADNAVTTVKVSNNAITLAKIQQVPTMTLVGRVTAGTGNVEQVSIITATDLSGASNSNLATSQAVKTYIDNRFSGIGSLVDAYVPATNFPTNPLGTKKGDYWYVTGSGTVQGVVLNNGDVIIANKDAASVTSSADWIFVESNRDQATTTVLGVIRLATQAEVNAGTVTNAAVAPSTLVAYINQRVATETITGVAEIATTAEVTAGTDNTRIVTPLKLKQYVDSSVLANNGVEFPSALASSAVITHNLNTLNLNVDIYRVSDGAQILTGVTLNTVNQVTVNFGSPQAINSFRIVIGRR